MPFEQCFTIIIRSAVSIHILLAQHRNTHVQPTQFVNAPVLVNSSMPQRTGSCFVHIKKKCGEGGGVTPGVGRPRDGAVARAVDQGHRDAHSESMRGGGGGNGLRLDETGAGGGGGLRSRRVQTNCRIPGVGCPEDGAVARAVDQAHPDAPSESMRGFADSSTDLCAPGCASAGSCS